MDGLQDLSIQFGRVLTCKQSNRYNISLVGVGGPTLTKKSLRWELESFYSHGVTQLLRIKLVNVVPVHNAKDHVENYRPISLLPIASKVFERCVLNSIKDHLYHVSSPKQHGFVLEDRALPTCLRILTALVHF